MTSPEFFIRAERSAGIHSKFAAPTPNSRPATGSTATGSISALPIFCREEKRILNMLGSCASYAL
jgi:hypothetical protein